MNVQLFWHVAIMGSWRKVTEEQAALFSRVGLRPMIGIVGPRRRMHFKRLGDIVYRGRSVKEYETPTVQKLWEWCIANPSDAVLYCHTKGVSKPGKLRDRWRALMEKWVVERWKSNLHLLEDHDIIGVDFMHRNRGYGKTEHFSGNFWMARADWIAKLMSPVVYRDSLPRHRKRYAPEMWPLTTPGYRFVSLCCMDEKLARGSTVIRMLRKSP